MSHCSASRAVPRSPNWYVTSAVLWKWRGVSLPIDWVGVAEGGPGGADMVIVEEAPATAWVTRKVELNRRPRLSVPGVRRTTSSCILCAAKTSDNLARPTVRHSLTLMHLWGSLRLGT
jgi:hypothetical protein